MLNFGCMSKRIVRHAARLAFAFLIIVSVPSTLSLAVGLRDEAVTYRIQGYEAQQRGDQGSALTLYQKAAALDPTYPSPHNDMGVVLEGEGRLEDAEGAYQQAVTLNPGYLEAHANLAMLYERMGKKEQAIYHWLKRYQQGDPYDPWTVRAEERLVKLGVLQAYPGLKGKIFTRRRLLGGEFQAFDHSLEEFRAVTEDYGDWP